MGDAVVLQYKKTDHVRERDTRNWRSEQRDEEMDCRLQLHSTTKYVHLVVVEDHCLQKMAGSVLRELAQPAS